MRSLFRFVAAVVLGLAVGLMAGCPNSGDDGSTSGVTAKIGISATRGPAPLRISVSAAASTSKNGAISATAWDFGGEESATTTDAAHTFTNPGKYTVALTVTDETGAIDTARAIVQVQGTSATADIVATPPSGAAPLTVQFDGRASSAADDQIEDYFWDFGDLTSSSDDNPTHTYRVTGRFTVSLRVVSFGGVEDTATTTIDVQSGAPAGGSLQFNGSQFATLPATAAATDAFTLETWIKPQAEGGTIASFGTPGIALEVLPSSNLLRLRVGSDSFEATVVNMTAQWSYVVLTLDATNGLTVYVNNVSGLSAAFASTIDVSQVLLGGGLRGNIGRTKFWSATRTAAQIASDATADLSGSETDLVGDWRFTDGAGQTLRNRATSGQAGILGATSALESADPAWSSDSP